MANDSSSGTKLKIIQGQKQGTSFSFNESQSPNVITVCFNPPDYTLNKSTSFSEAKIPGLDSPIIQFNQGEAQSLSLKLLLDTYTTDSDQVESVKTKYIDKFEKLIKIDSELHAPPPCQVLWGTLDFKGVVQKLDKEFIMFSNDGTPVRARVTLDIKEYIPLDLQLQSTPTSSPDRRKLWLVKEGESLWMIAHRAYSDPAHWRVIAHANNIDDPKEIEPGTEIIIPVLKQNQQK